MAEQQQKNLADWLQVPKAKRGAKVGAISDVLRGKHVSGPVVAYGVTYTLRTLEPWEETWADGIIASGTAFQAGNAIPKAYLAAALLAIDGSPVEAEFAVPDGLDPEVRKVLVEKPDILRDWRWRQVHEWICHDLQPEVITLLWEGYVELCMQRKSLLEGIPGLSQGTPSGRSSGTSLPVRESSSPTQASGA